MAMIKTLARAHGGCRQIKSYLEKDGRAVTFDCSGDLGIQDWDETMDSLRRAWGKDSGRRYYHFIISPDPQDGADIETVRDLAVAWVEGRYPNGQWVIETHVDNGIPHAHVVVNAVTGDGSKIHLSNRDVQQDAAEIQRLCLERGLSAFDNYSMVRADEGWIAKSALPARDVEASRRKARPAARSQRRSQDWMRKKGVRLWTDAVREVVESSLEGCRSWSAFERALAGKGYLARVSRRGVLTFYPPKGEGHPVKGYKLDDSYTVEGIRARLSPSLERSTPVRLLEEVPKPSMKIPKTFAECVSVTGKRRLEHEERTNELKAVLDAAAIVAENGYTSYSQLAAAAASMEKSAKEIARRLDDARLAFEQIDEAAKAVIEREALEGRMGRKPRSKMLERRWRASNAVELARIAEIDEWMSERGVDAGTTLTEIRERRKELRTAVERLSDAASEIGIQAERTCAAARAIGALTGAALLPSSLRSREPSGKEANGKRKGGSTALREVMKEHLARSAELGRLLAKGDLDARRDSEAYRARERMREAANCRKTGEEERTARA